MSLWYTQKIFISRLGLPIYIHTHTQALQNCETYIYRIPSRRAFTMPLKTQITDKGYNGIHADIVNIYTRQNNPNRE